MVNGFPDPNGGAPEVYGDVPLEDILEGIETISLKDKEASASTSLLKAQRGLRDPSLPAYKRISEYAKAIEAVGRHMDNAFEIAQCITHCDPDGIPTGTATTPGSGEPSFRFRLQSKNRVDLRPQENFAHRIFVNPFESTFRPRFSERDFKNKFLVSLC